jgi:hypothetical protein
MDCTYALSLDLMEPGVRHHLIARFSPLICRPLSWIGRPSRRAIPGGIQVSTGALSVMCRGLL